MTVNPYHIRGKPRSNLHAWHFAWLPLVLTGSLVEAQTCPDTGSAGTGRPALSHNTVDYSGIPIQFSFDGGSSVLNGKSDLTGAQVSQGERSLSADALHYDFISGKIKADGNVSYEDPQLRVSGSDANMDTTSGVEFDGANFALKARAGRGSADHIQLTPQGNLHLDGVSYTTCPANKPDWELKLSNLDINQATRTGTGRNVRLEFKNIPVFYTPWISFPLGDERKTGFLFPSFRSSSRGGYSLLVPWYWNIAPNYDATIMPIIDSVRGLELDSEFRYLSEWNKGIVLADYVPHDPRQSTPDTTSSSNSTSGGDNSDNNVLHNWRGLLQVKHQTDFNPNLRLQLNGTTVSDNHWFEDFGQTRDETSQVYLPQILNFSAYSNNWVGSIAIQNLQVLDDQIVKNDPDIRPYITAPQITIAGHERQLPFGFDFDFDGELAYFTRDKRLSTDGLGHDPNITGARLYAAPTLSLPLRTPGMYVIPSAGWRYTTYHLDGAGENRSPTLSAPISSLDMGMTFERISPGEQRLYTLQPRILYLYTPFRKQTDIPLFDTGLPDFNLVQLFRTERFIGPDRLGDTNQISVGVTTRMLDAHSGKQFLSGTLGQAFYLNTPCVSTVDSLPDTCSQQSGGYHSSPVIGQVALSAYKNWTASVGVQWDPLKSQLDRSEINFQYRPANNRVVNLIYRFARSIDSTSATEMSGNTQDPNNRVDQWESSFAWPVGINWSTYGRVVYSRLDEKLHDYLGGIEYRSCCWNLRLVFGRSITTREGRYDTRLNLQFEFKGLGSAGTADTLLENAIPGYSTRHP